MSDPAEAGNPVLTEASNEGEVVFTTPHASAGEALRLAREAAGLHIAALAVSLKVPVKKLEALEADRFDLLPDAVFVRALASSVCRTLKVDPGPVLQLLPQSSSPKLLYQGAGINAPFRAPSDGPGPSAWTQVSRPAVLAGLAFLLAALVLIMMPSLRTGMGDTISGAGSPTQSSAPVKTAEVNVVGEAREQDAPKKPDAQPESGASAEQSVVTSALLSSQAYSAPAVSASSEPVRPLVASLSQPPAGTTTPSSAVAAPLLPSSGIVVFTAKSESWVEVTDSKGQVVLRRILAAGEVAGASGALPLAAVVGRADATQVQIRGKAFDLSALAKDNVARFEVK
ncbi:MAG: helix-turn-helix domain-containing protein [Polaromonas sp.]|uniref:helix-turn-helix domain-containing protein n=1 Tax=Polaromonas sp. TaxID=1869339 RepID=UPI0025D27899|nr:helix-turn-helix domain-containing protein [Polaromonas sp.]MBI2724712.1 helix-turn-helix domain-containing protein [Polaromonas sp.]